MQKPVCALALFIILSLSSLFAQETPQLASALSAAVGVHGTVSATGGDIRSLQMNISIPSSTPYQIVEAGEKMEFDSDGNGYLAISSANPSNPFTYSKRIGVQSVARATPSLPESYSVPQEYWKFSSATNRTQSGDAGIRALAQNITAGAQTPFEKVALLAIYVNGHMEYDAGMVGQEKDALWVKENMRGVCTEYSTLFTALARSAGIPARYVSGYVYSDKFHEWMGHSWAEAYVGKWVPVDPTWLEVGALDAMHIEESKYAEFTSRDSLSASVSRPGVALDWDTGEKNGAVAGNIQTINVTYGAPYSGFTFDSPAHSLAPGGTTFAYLAMNGTDYRAIPLSLAGCVGTESVLLDESERYLILEPNKTSTMVWQLNASSSLPRNYLYTCPLTLNSPYLETRALAIKVDPELQPSPYFEASLHESDALPGQENSVFIGIPRSLRGKEFTAVLPDGVYGAQSSGAVLEIPFSTQAAGNVPVFVASESGGMAELGYASGPQPGIRITAFSLPPALIAGKAALAQANISAISYPAEFALDFTFGSQSGQIAGKLSGPESFSFSFTPDSPGTYTARMSASSQGSSSEENQVATVAAAPMMAIDKVGTAYSNGTLYTTVSFLQSGSPASPTASVAGSAYSASSPLVLALPPGSYPLLLSWSDAAGNSYSASEQITVSQPGLLSAAAPAQGCPLATALLFTVLIFSASVTSASARKRKV
ncbi:MAG: transglutaminase-like domain-containing protein [Candidatus Micrarchaeia archaeon]